MHSAGTQQALSMHLAGTQQALSVHLAGTQHALNVHLASTQHAHSRHSACTHLARRRIEHQSLSRHSACNQHACASTPWHPSHLRSILYTSSATVQSERSLYNCSKPPVREASE